MKQNDFRSKNVNNAGPFTQSFKKLVLKNLKDQKVLRYYLLFNVSLPFVNVFYFTVIAITNILFTTAFYLPLGKGQWKAILKDNYLSYSWHLQLRETGVCYTSVISFRERRQLGFVSLNGNLAVNLRSTYPSLLNGKGEFTFLKTKS